MKIIEVFPAYNEIEFLKIRSDLKLIDNLEYDFIVSILDCTHTGSNINFDIKNNFEDLFGNHFLHFLHQSKKEVEEEFNNNKEIYNEFGFSKNWMYEIGQRLVFYAQLEKKFDQEGYPDILILSDADELLSENDLINIQKVPNNIFRLAMSWYICDPIFKYHQKWPGAFVLKGSDAIKIFLKSKDSPMRYHRTRTLDFCKLNGGMHLTYFGEPYEFRQKCKRIAESSAKRVKLASVFGPTLLKLGIDPFLRSDLKISRCSPPKQISFLCKNSWRRLI